MITDLGMPYVDGREVIKTLKLEAPAVPVFLLTGWGKKMQAEGAIPSSANVVINKPPTMDALRSALSRVN